MLTIVICLVVIGVACFAVLRITFEDEKQPATAPKQRHRAPEGTSAALTGVAAAGLEDETDVIEVESAPTARPPSPPEPPGPSVDALADDTVATKITTIAVPPAPPTPPAAPAPPASAATETLPFGGTALPDIDEPSPAATGLPDDLDDLDGLDDRTEPLVLDDRTEAEPRSTENLDEGRVAPPVAIEAPGEASPQSVRRDDAPVRLEENPTPGSVAPPRHAVEGNGEAPTERPSGVFDDDVATVVLTPIDARRRLRSTFALLLTLTVVGTLVALAVVLLLGLVILAVRSALGA